MRIPKPDFYIKTLANIFLRIGVVFSNFSLQLKQFFEKKLFRLFTLKYMNYECKHSNG